MIQVSNLVKKFDDYNAVNNMSLYFDDNSITGLVGTNGSGKSTLLRSLVGVYKPDSGSIKVDGEEVFENMDAKLEIFYVSDDMYFPSTLNLEQVGKFYKSVYPKFDEEKFKSLLTKFPIDSKKRTSTYSKGMFRQAALIIAVSCCPKYLLLDEAFDGLDPVVRVAVRKVIAEEVSLGNMSVIIASHNLRELEDLCDTVCIMHHGELIVKITSQEIGDHFCKIQAAFNVVPEKERLMFNNVMTVDIQGKIATIAAKCKGEEIIEKLNDLNPVFTESMPMSLEEVFIYEMEAIGYDYNKIIF